MNHQDTERKRAVLFCTCSGACPSMEKIDFWALAERVRLELGDQIEFMALHPRLCEEDGERLMGRVLSDDIACITSACAEKKQQKLLREGFEKAGIPMDPLHWIPVSMAQEDTATVFERIKGAIETKALVEDATDEATAG
jgi:hypothetical protein